MTSAGELRHRVGFFQRELQSDGFGNEQAGFPSEPEFSVAAAVAAKFGGETVLAQRLQGQQTYTITVRQSAKTKLVTSDWKARDMRSGQEYAIKSGPVDPDDCSMWLEFLCQSGVAP